VATFTFVLPKFSNLIGGLVQPVLVIGTVKDLVADSGITFPDTGSQELKGLPGEWKLFVAET
jgi:hypothetical protein